MAINLAHQLRDLTQLSDLDRFVQNPDQPKSYLYQNGTGDQEFTWQFGTYIATQVVYRFEQDKLLSQADLSRMTLSDWADIIGSEWFGDLLHDMAIAAPAAYRDIGVHPLDYTPNTIDMASRHNRSGELWDGLPDKLFETTITTTPFAESELDGLSVTSPTATLTPIFRQTLRKSVRYHGYNDSGKVLISQRMTSAGCPVARSGFEIDPSHQEDYEELATRGLASLIEQRGKLFARQAFSPIDRYLELLAAILVDIDRTHGTPLLQSDNSLAYTRLPKAGHFFAISDSTTL